MNMKRLSLIFALSAFPAVHAHAASITFNVPYELTNVPAANTRMGIQCQVGVGVHATWGRTGVVGVQNSNTIDLSGTNRNFRGTVRVTISAPVAGRSLDEATHYRCMGLTIAGQPAFSPAIPFATGIIPR